MQRLAAFGPLVGLAAILSAFASLYVILGEQPPEAVLAIFRVAPGIFLVYWVVVDARLRRRVPCHDFGFLVGVFLWVALPWYLIWSRGVRGLLVLGFFLFLLVAPQIIASIVEIVRYGPP